MKRTYQPVILLEKEDMVFVLEWLLQMVERSLIRRAQGRKNLSA